MLKGFLTILFAVSASVLTSLLLNYFTSIPNPNWWISLLIYTIIFIVLNFVYNLRMQQSTYAEMLLGTIVGKMLLLLIVIFVYSVLDKDGLFGFSLHFISHYILFTVFEIRYLLTIIKKREIKQP